MLMDMLLKMSNISINIGADAKPSHSASMLMESLMISSMLMESLKTSPDVPEASRDSPGTQNQEI